MDINREIAFGENARKKLLEGCEIMYRSVAVTLGPKSRNVAIAREWANPIIIDDGVTVASAVADNDLFKMMGINLIREAAQKTNDEAGDGTTTSILLAYFMVKYGMELIKKGKNPRMIRRELEASLVKILEELKKLSRPVKGTEEVIRIAEIASYDKEAGKLVAEAVKKVGKDGTIAVEKSTDQKTYIDYSEGIQIDKGYKNWRFSTNPKTMEAVIEDCVVLVLGKKVTAEREIVPLLEVVFQKSKNVVIFGDVDGIALRILLQNKLQGIVSCVVVDPPGYADRREALLEDIAISTGGKVIKDELGLDMANFAKQFDYDKNVGRARRVTASKSKTVIVTLEDKKIKEAIAERIKVLKAQKDVETNTFEKEKIDERLAKLTMGVATIRVGAKSDLQQREKEDKIRDSVAAAQEAIEEGIVPGGGVAFLKILKALDGDQSDGAGILRKVLPEQIKKILINAGEDIRKLDAFLEGIESKGGNAGYDMESGEIVDMMEKGIIDPTKVLRLALENAVSVSSSILTTDTLIAIRAEKNETDKG